MKYTLEHIKLLKARDGFYNGNTIKGGLYIQATLIDDEGEDDGIYTSNDEAEVARYTEYLAPSISSGQKDSFGMDIYNDAQLKDANKPLPENLSRKTGDWETVELPGTEPYVFVRGNQSTNQLEVVVNRYGAYKPVRSVDVFCRKKSDGTYRHGWTPQARMQAMIGRIVAPISQVKLPNQPGGIVSQSGVVPGAQSVPGAQAQAQSQSQGQGQGTIPPQDNPAPQTVPPMQ